MNIFTIFLLGVAGYIFLQTMVNVGKLFKLLWEDKKHAKNEKSKNWYYQLGLYETGLIKHDVYSSHFSLLILETTRQKTARA